MKHQVHSRHGTRSSETHVRESHGHIKLLQGQPRSEGSDEVTDEEFWSTEVSIDDLIGPGVVFNFPSQISTIPPRPKDDLPGGRISALPPLQWSFTPAEYSHPHLWLFNKQTSPSSSVTFFFPRQLDSLKLGVRDFQRQLDEPDVDVHRFWHLCRQLMKYGGSIRWNFREFGRESSRIVWFFPRQSGSSVSMESDWYFLNQLAATSMIKWDFNPQCSRLTPISWTFTSQTPARDSVLWRFMRQTSEESSVTMASLPRQIDTLKHSGVRWKFDHLSDQSARMRWNFDENLKKNVHNNVLRWSFKKNLSEDDEEDAVSWDFNPQTSNMRGVSWNMKSLTEGLGAMGTYEEVLKENDAFKQQYSRAYGQTYTNGKRRSSYERALSVGHTGGNIKTFVTQL